MEKNIIGAYGAWAAGLMEGRLPTLSYRGDRFQDVREWREQVRPVLKSRLASPPMATPSQVTVLEQTTYDDLHIERLRWQVGYGPATEAVVLKPRGTTGPLPGVLALHDHSGKKYWGLQKIARYGPPHPLMIEHQQKAYGGRAWANELARAGYVVLVHDAFAFASRRIRPEDCLPYIAEGVPDGRDDDTTAIAAYQDWAGGQESNVAKSLFCAGTTWPGVCLAEDQAALDVLANRSDVDAVRLGCGGLSGGGMRTCFLAAMDDRIQAALCAGFMSTWRDFLLYKAWTHTWMMYVPLLPNELDFPEILGLHAPRAAMVMATTEDFLFTLPEVRRSEQMLREIWAKAGAGDKLEFRYYPGPHKMDVPMQQEAFAWFDKQLKNS